MSKLLNGLMWAARADETLAQAARAACQRCEEKEGRAAEVVLVHRSVELEVEGLEVRPSPYIGGRRLVFVGWEE